eukprot:gene19420-14111_t
MQAATALDAAEEARYSEEQRQKDRQDLEQLGDLEMIAEAIAAAPPAALPAAAAKQAADAEAARALAAKAEELGGGTARKQRTEELDRIVDAMTNPEKARNMEARATLDQIEKNMKREMDVPWASAAEAQRQAEKALEDECARMCKERPRGAAPAAPHPSAFSSKEARREKKQQRKQQRQQDAAVSDALYEWAMGPDSEMPAELHRKVNPQQWFSDEQQQQQAKAAAPPASASVGGHVPIETAAAATAAAAAQWGLGDPCDAPPAPAAGAMRHFLLSAGLGPSDVRTATVPRGDAAPAVTLAVDDAAGGRAGDAGRHCPAPHPQP